MLNDNIKKLRKKQNLTQEALASRMCVVRQTISKWENGISVPDAEQLIRLADILGVSVSELIGPSKKDEKKQNAISIELARVNEQLASKNMRTKKIIKDIFIILLVLLLVYVILCIINIFPA